LVFSPGRIGDGFLHQPAFVVPFHFLGDPECHDERRLLIRLHRQIQ
jgi:hypothetical protein